jgi:hypothetical protein
MIKKSIIITLSLLMMPLSLVAQEVKKDTPAFRLLKVMNFKQNIIDGSDAGFILVANSLEASNLNEAEMAEVKVAFLEYMIKLANDPELSKKVAEIYNTNFTEEEIKGLITFYQTALGKKALKALPTVMGESMKISTSLAQKHVGSFHLALKDILQRKAAKK